MGGDILSSKDCGNIYVKIWEKRKVKELLIRNNNYTKRMVCLCSYDRREVEIE